MGRRARIIVSVLDRSSGQEKMLRAAGKRLGRPPWHSAARPTAHARRRNLIPGSTVGVTGKSWGARLGIRRRAPLPTLGAEQLSTVGVTERRIKNERPPSHGAARSDHFVGARQKFRAGKNLVVES
ncbi:MAG: hypothetical protein IJU71_05610 [Selenomonadaceae bacterium]|nr:hypothetical protein [Selenomonadaceae bacterium]